MIRFRFFLIKYRKLKGYSQVKLAELTGLHRTYISDVELKKRSISLNNIQKIADALEVPCHVLFLEKL
ncbi:helix-turn-helix domain-containing protein [Thomasclavelia cocleata]|uniref:helix-turn-helix domain-containing protein n=1 Tax=Thomasclavelia cocleata TaxID=69824 RepID=UPI00272E1370|nr:helix-turn-helix transcriptional regulator [Thomasclavelia cocleata]